MNLPKKKCTKCARKLDTSNFNKDKSKPDGLYIWCKKCLAAHHLKYNKKLRRRKKIHYPRTKLCPSCNENKKASEFYINKSNLEGLSSHCILCYRKNSLKKKYNMTIEQWEDIFESQGRRCFICRNNVTNKVGWVVDHDHKTGKNRAILCDSCNKMLGHAKENPETLLSASNYLKSEGLSITN